MNDVTQTTPANSPEARAPDGSLISQTTTTSSNSQPATTPPTTPTTPPAQTEQSLAAETETGAPESYADFTFPEGFEVNAEALTKFQEVAKGANLTQAQAQSFMDLYSAQIAAATKDPVQAVNEMRAEWRNTVLADTTLAANGALRPEVKSTIARAIDSLGPQIAAPFREAMNLTGAGDHPAFLKAFHAIAQRLSEGRAVRPGAPAPVANPTKPSGPGANALWPGLNSSAQS